MILVIGDGEKVVTPGLVLRQQRAWTAHAVGEGRVGVQVPAQERHQETDLSPETGAADQRVAGFLVGVTGGDDQVKAKPKLHQPLISL